MESISPQLIIEEAKKKNYTIKIISEKLNIFTITGNNKQVLFKNIDCWINNSLGVRFSRYKNLSYFMLKQANIKVPQSFVLSRKWKFMDVLKNIKENNIHFPLVVKPATGEHGNWVSINIRTEEHLKKAIKYALNFHHQIIIQEFFPWADHRLFVVWHKFIAAMQRLPAFVIGNGKDTIKSLIQKENNNPFRWDGHTSQLTKISIDTELKNIIKLQWLTIQSIIPKNKKIFLRKNANLSTWWISIDVTDKVHPEIKKMAERASRILHLQVCGIDYLSTDISKPLSQQKWWIIEVNHTPWLRGHHFPAVGKSRNVAKAILTLAFKK